MFLLNFASPPLLTYRHSLVNFACLVFQLVSTVHLIVLYAML